MSRTLARYLLVGLFNTALCLALIVVLREWAVLNDTLANFLGYAFGLAVSFGLNRRWTFRQGASPYRQLPRFVLVLGVAWGCNMVLVLLLIRMGASAFLAHAAGVPIYTAVSYLGCARYVFPRAAPAVHATPQ